MTSFLLAWYDWIKALHVISVMAWMAAMFYLPRLFVYHVEQGQPGSDKDAMLQVMERKLLRGIMNPSMAATWTFGLLMVLSGTINWAELWPWLKAAAVLAMSAFHGFLSARRRAFAEGRNLLSGRQWRMLNEVPPVLMVVIVIAVIVRPF